MDLSTIAERIKSLSDIATSKLDLLIGDQKTANERITKLEKSVDELKKTVTNSLQLFERHVEEKIEEKLTEKFSGLPCKNSNGNAENCTVGT